MIPVDNDAEWCREMSAFHHRIARLALMSGDLPEDENVFENKVLADRYTRIADALETYYKTGTN